jgi:hypothetical protein
LKRELSELDTVENLNASLALKGKGYVVVQDSQSITQNALRVHLQNNDFRTFVDMEDPQNKDVNILAVYYTEDNIARMLLEDVRDFYFEMDSNLVNRFIKLINEGHSAKSLFQNLNSLFRHHNFYIRGISVDTW